MIIRPHRVARLLALTLLASSTIAQARDPAQVRAFRAAHPCPATGNATGACPGWRVDHAIPLCAGGADEPRNMHWQSLDESKLKDADERRLCARLRGCKP